jgi:ribosome biogenesis GTPase
MDNDFNIRRIERYIAAVWESGATPVVLLNKIDLCDDLDARLSEAESAAPGVTVLPVSGATGEGLESLRAYLQPCKTVAFLGSSGVGKSTLTNALLGEEVQSTGGLRRGDGRGHHTTTSRQLITTPGGAMLIDTPGLREIQLTEGASVAEAFDDIEALAPDCKFSDCRHVTEPGCAVRAAAESGALPDARYQSFLKLQGERDARANRNAQALGQGVGRVARQRKHQRAK